MSLLLSDSSLCLNDFSRILYSPPSEWNLHVDVVDAPVVGSGLKQHIEYKITITLYLHGTYPAFSPARLFGNTEPAVIAERTEAIKRFLNFVFNSEVLRKSTSLHHFFESKQLEQQSGNFVENKFFDIMDKENRVD
uniref:PX domain-containing protein n=1 Tax=Syphacia muris TaxID=451379 RepID=A0A0N5APT5_9BILA